MKRNLAIITVTASVILVVVLITLHHQSASREEVVSQFREHHLSNAQHLASQIKFFLQTRSQELQTLASFAPLQSGNLGQKQTHIQVYSKMMDYVRAISLYDETGTIIYSTDSRAIGQNRGRRDFFVWAKDRANKGKVFVLPLFQGGSFLSLLATPLFRNPLMQSI